MALYILDTPKKLREAERGVLMKAPCLGFDVECTDLFHDRLGLVGAGFSTGAKGDHFYIPVGHEFPSQLTTLPARELFVAPSTDHPKLNRSHYVNAPFDAAMDTIRRVASRADLECIVHNYKYEIGVLKEYGIQPRWQARDTMLVNWMLTGRGKNDLATVVNHFLKRGRSDSKFQETVAPFGGRIEWTPVPVAANYCARMDAGDTFDLWDRYLEDLLIKWGLEKVFYELEMEMPEILQHMERRGVCWDLPRLAQFQEACLTELEEVDEAFYELVGKRINIGSTQQLSVLMFEELEWWDTAHSKQGKPRNSDGKQFWSTSASVVEAQYRGGLTEEGRNAALLLLRRRKLSKIESVYTHSLIDQARHHEDRRVHHSFMQHGTDTGRFSASRIQQIPRPSNDESPNEWERNLPPIRDAVIAPGTSSLGALPGLAGGDYIEVVKESRARPDDGDEWVLLGGDYSQVELRVMAHESQDPRLLHAYRTGEDIHRLTASQVGSSRQDAKAINFGLIYLMSAWTLAGQIGVEIGTAQRYHDGYFTAYSGVRTYHKKVIAYATTHGFVRTIAGRFREIPNIQLRPRNKQDQKRLRAAHRMAVNTRIQGSAADILKIGMRNVVRRLKAMGLWETVVYLTIQVHDELIFECRKSHAAIVSAVIREEMENAVTLRVPLVFEVKQGRTWMDIK